MTRAFHLFGLAVLVTFAACVGEIIEPGDELDGGARDGGFEGGVFVLVADGPHVARSLDGLSWTPATTLPPTGGGDTRERRGLLRSPRRSLCSRAAAPVLRRLIVQHGEAEGDLVVRGELRVDELEVQLPGAIPRHSHRGLP
jgi:hypothetical protein